MTQPENIRTIHADSGDVALTLDQRDLILTLYDGYIVDVDRKNPSSLNRVYFSANRMKVEGVGNELRRMDQERVKGEREQSICEMDEKYQASYRKQEVYKYNIRQRMIEVSRIAVSGDGEPFRQFDEPPVKAARTWGSSYCDGLKALAEYIPGLETGTEAPLEEPSDGAPADSISAGMAPPTSEPAAAQAAASAMAAADPGIPPEQPDPDAYSAISNSYFSESVRTSIEEANFGIMLSRRQMDTFSVEIHKKFSLAAACVVFIILGVPFALRFARGGVGIVIGASLVIFAVSYVGLIAGEGLAKAGKLSPFVAMWGANFALAVIGGVLLLRMGRESIKKGNVFAALIDEMRERINLRRTGGRR
jgi:lipopolysaccharide export system permease protein